MAFSTSGRREDVSLKLRAKNLRNAREQTTQLELDNRKMAERLEELKTVMNLEKETRERNNTGFWSKGQEGKLTNYATDVIQKPQKSKSGKRRVKVLKDEPVAPPERPKGPGTMAFLAQKGTTGVGKENKNKGPRCGQCEERAAHVSCMECGEDYCASCFAGFHLKGALKKHRSVPLGTGGVRTPRGTPRGNASNTSVASSGETSLVPSPPKPNSSRNSASSETNPHRLTLTEIDVSFAQEALRHDSPPPDHTGGNLLDGEYNEANNAADFQAALKAWRQEKNTDKKNAAVKKEPPPQDNNSSNGHILDGEYNEAKSAASFQAALKDWRGETNDKKVEKNTANRQRARPVSPVRSPIVNMDEGTSTEVPRQTPVDVKFKHSLSYAERLLLKKHRRCEIDPLSDDMSSAGRSSETPSTGFTDDNISEIRLSARTPRDLMRREDTEETEVEVLMDRPDSSLSIVEIPVRMRTRGIEQTSSYEVTEIPDEPLPRSARTRRSKKSSKEAFGEARKSASLRKSSNLEQTQNDSKTKPDDLTTSRSNSRLKSKSSTQLTEKKTNHKTSHQNEATDLDLKGAKAKDVVRPRSVVKSRSDARPKSARRPGSRAQSRAQSRLEQFGEGVLTKTPSDALKQIASMSAYTDPSMEYKLGLTDYFTAGVHIPQAFTERVLTPSISKSRPSTARKDAQNDKYKISNKLYQMAPRSWRPESSMSQTVDDDAVAAHLDDVGVRQYREFLETETPVGESEQEKEERLHFSVATGVEKLGSFVKGSWSVDQSVAPNEPMNPAHRPDSSMSSRTMTPNMMTPRSRYWNQQRDAYSPTDTATPRPQSNLDTPTPRAVYTPRSARRQQASRASSRADSVLSERPQSQMIVMDGQDLSFYDNIEEKQEQFDEDQETLDQLEWELASQTGNLTDDGKLSRMSMQELDDADDSGPMPKYDPHPREQGFDIQNKLRESELMDDWDEMEAQIMCEEDVLSLR